MPLWLVGQLHNKVWIWHHGSFTCSVKHNTANTRNKWKNYICHRDGMSTDRTIEFLILKEHLVDVALTKVALADSLDTWTQATHSWVAWRIAWILTRIASVPDWKRSLENPWEPRLTQQTGTQQAADSQLVVKPENRIYPQYITPSEMSLVRFHVQAKRICKQDGKDMKRYEKMNPNTLIKMGLHDHHESASSCRKCRHKMCTPRHRDSPSGGNFRYRRSCHWPSLWDLSAYSVRSPGQSLRFGSGPDQDLRPWINQGFPLGFISAQKIMVFIFTCFHHAKLDLLL